MCITQPSFYKWRNTPCCWTYKWVQIYKTCWFEFDSLLTWQEGLVSVLLLVTAPFRKQCNFGNIYGSTPACNIDKMQSTMFVNGMSIKNKICSYQRCSIFTAGALTTRFQSDDKSNCSTENQPRTETKGWVMEGNCFNPKLSSRRLSGTDHMHLDYWL